MLTFNNKILTVSNKGLEVEAGPTPPPPGPSEPTLITTIDAISWSQSMGYGSTPVTLNYSERYVCIKFWAYPSSPTSSSSFIGLTNKDHYYGMLWGGSSSEASTDYVALDKGQLGYETALSNFVCDNGNDTTNFCISDCPWRDLEYVKFIFDTTTSTVYCYVNDIRLCHGNYTSSTFNLNSFDIMNSKWYYGGQAGPFYIYESDSLEALEDV